MRELFLYSPSSRCHKNSRIDFSASLAMEGWIAPLQNKRKLKAICHKSSLFREASTGVGNGDWWMQVMQTPWLPTIIPCRIMLIRWIVILSSMMISVVEWFASVRRSETEPNAVCRCGNALSRHLYARAECYWFLCSFSVFVLSCCCV